MSVLGLDDLVEALAAHEHERWSGWERYRETAVAKVVPGIEPPEERWRRQRSTLYADLSEREKESDRVEVRKTLSLLASLGVKLVLPKEL